MRLFFILIALSFVVVGGVSLVGESRDNSVVSFDHVENISTREFLINRERYIKAIQKQSNFTMSPEQLKELNINQMVLSTLIHNRMKNYLVKIYDLDITEDQVLKIIKKLPDFQNDQKKFDVNIFNALLGDSDMNKEQYVQDLKFQLITDLVMQICMNSISIPNVFIKNVIAHAAQTRTVDLVSVNLMQKDDQTANIKATDEELLDYYNRNKNAFTIAEKRKFSYIAINDDYLSSKIKISDDEIKNYFEENKKQLAENSDQNSAGNKNSNVTKEGNKNGSGSLSTNFELAKKDIRENLKESKIIELSNQIVSNIEQDISSGMLIEELAQKYEMKVNSVTHKSYEELVNRNGDNLAKIANSIFKMSEKELSYPIEIENSNEIYIVCMESIQLPKLQDFDNVKQAVSSIVIANKIANHNIEKLKNLHAQYNLKNTATNKIANQDFKKQHINVIKDYVVNREGTSKKDTLDPNLLRAIFDTKVNNNTKIVTVNNEAYFAHIKKIGTDKEKINKLSQKEVRRNIDSHMKEEIINDLVKYLTKINNMQIHSDRLMKIIQ